jgi:hypothetical protein
MATLFTVTLESNNLRDGSSGFDTLGVHGGRIYVASPGLNSTSYKLGAQAVSDTVGAYGQMIQSLSGLSGYTVTMYFDPNSISIGSGGECSIMRGVDSTPTPSEHRSAIQLGYSGGNYYISAGHRDDGDSYSWTSGYTVSDAEHYVTIGVARATGAATSDGVLELSIDGVSQQTISNIDNYDTFADVDRFRFGFMQYGVITITGTLFVDQITVTDDSPTGETVLPHIVLSGHAILSGHAVLGG